jgi:hypothetical protein
MSSPATSRGVFGSRRFSFFSTMGGIAVAMPMHLGNVLAQDYPAMEAPPDYVEQQNERQRDACIFVWGALAVSASTLSWGASWNYNDEAAASQNAMSRCRAGGASDCKVAVTVADVCVSLAASPGKKVFAIGGPIGAANYAEDAALAKCKRAGGQACAVTTSFCADGIQHVVNGHTVFSNGNPILVPDGPKS